MIAFGMLMAATMGSGTYVDGLACTPTSPATLGVNIGQGSIMSLQTVDPNAYGTLGTNNNNLVKMGINIASTALSLSGLAPTTPGQSVNVLIEGQFLEADGSPVILPYYNSANPTSPLNGPAGAGTAQNTRRTQTVNLRLKSGSAGTTGAQPTPSADSGCAPLYIVTLAYGQTTVAAGNIALAPNAPFIGTKLAQLRTKLMANLSLYVSVTGSDSNNGLSTNSAFLTLQAAWNALINNYDLSGYSVTINVGAGTFVGVVCQGSPQGYGSSSVVTISGAGAGSTTISGPAVFGSINASAGANITVQNLTSSGVAGIISGSGGVIAIGPGITTGALSGTGPKLSANGGVITLGSGFTDTGNAASCIGIGLFGIVTTIASGTITEVGTPTYSQGYVVCSAGQLYITTGIAFSGSATGPKFVVNGGGFINTNGAGTSYFPGSTAGTYGSGNNIGFYA